MFQKELYNGIPKCYCVASATKTFTLKGVQFIHRSTPTPSQFSFLANLCSGIIVIYAGILLLKIYWYYNIYNITFSWSWHYLEVNGQLHDPAALTPRKEPPPLTHWIRLCGPSACQDDMQKWTFLTLPELELRFLGRPAVSHSLYRLYVIV
jgi:hypothetical protein